MAIRFWQVRDDSFSFGYSTHRQPDGKFHAYKFQRQSSTTLRGGQVKDVAFGKRRVAKARAYHWYCRRKEALDKMVRRSEEKRKAKPQPTATEKKIKALKKKIDNARKRKQEMVKVVTQSRKRIKRAKTQYHKWQKKEQRWVKELAEAEKGNEGKIKSFVETLEP